MAKKHKSKRKIAGANSKRTEILENGYDFGDLTRVVAAAPTYFDFNNELISAEIAGCSYGFHTLDGHNGYIPLLTLLAKKSEHLIKAFEHFNNWGAYDDGDCVGITILLQKSGGYLLGIQPDYTRLAERLVPDKDIADCIYAGATWIKPIDSANPILKDWRKQLHSSLFPIVVDGAVVPETGDIPSPESIKQIKEIKPFIKFDLKIIEEHEDPDNLLLQVVQKKFQLKAKAPKDMQRTASGVAAARRRLIDSVFPVSRERIRRQGLYELVSKTLGFKEVTESQVEQAAINVTLSRTWTGGADHFQGIDDLKKVFFDYISTSSERCNQQNTLMELPLPVILRQIELDVAYTLRMHGANRSNKFKTNQHFFLRLGYGHS